MRLAAVLMLGSPVVGAGVPPVETPRSVSYMMRTMGTYAQVLVVTADSAAAAPQARAAQVELARIDSLMSNWTKTSEVARINRVAAAGPTPVQVDVATVIDTSLGVWTESDRTFDITVEPLMRAWGFLGGTRHVPTQGAVDSAYRNVGARRVHYDRAARSIRFDREGVKIDLGGIAKGYAVDLAARALAAAGVTDGLVNLSGNMFTLGSPAGADHWRIGIRDPRDRIQYFARIDLGAGEGISTSGKYEQFVAQDGRTYGHIMDPRVGHPAEGLISVTVVSNSAFTCDTWDTPLFVMGSMAGRKKALERRDFQAVLVAPGTSGVDTVWVESSLRERFVLEPQAAEWFRVRYF